MISVFCLIMIYIEEHLIPIQQNPILRSDLEKRHQTQKQTCNANYETTIQNLVASSSSKFDRNEVINGSTIPNTSNRKDNLTEEEEVEYGKGFVCKLLNRFKRLSGMNQLADPAPVTTLPKQTYSSDNILDDIDSTTSMNQIKTIKFGMKNSKVKFQSMENLLSDSVIKPHNAWIIHSDARKNDFVDGSQNNRVLDAASMAKDKCEMSCKENNIETTFTSEDELPRPNIVQLTRTVFESISTSPVEPVYFKPSFSEIKSQKPAVIRHDKTAVSTCLSSSDRTKLLDNHKQVASSTKNSNLPDILASAQVNGTNMQHYNQTEKTHAINNANRINGFEPEGNSKVNSSHFNTDSSLSSVHVESGNRSDISNFGTSPPKPELIRKNLNLNLTGLSQKPAEKSTADWRHLVMPKQEQTSKAEQNERVSSTSRPGLLLIRPASNLVSSGTKVEFLNLTKYNDVTEGKFAPATKKPTYYSDSSKEIPVTNIDDVFESDLPITDIDDLNAVSPREGEPGNNAVQYIFEGGGVNVGCSLLAKSKNAKLVSFSQSN